MAEQWDFPVKKSAKKKPTLVEVTINSELNEATANFIKLRDAAKELLSLKRQKEEIEERIKEVRIPLEEALALRGAPIEIDDIVWTLQDCEREIFRLKEARNHLKPELLKPFISVSRYTQLVPRAKK